MQNAPAAPDPVGLAASSALLGQANSFRDATGLSDTQANAAAALQASMAAARAFGSQAGSLAQQALGARQGATAKRQESLRSGIQPAIAQIRAARDAGLIDDEQARSVTESALRLASAIPVTTVRFRDLESR